MTKSLTFFLLVTFGCSGSLPLTDSQCDGGVCDENPSDSSTSDVSDDGGDRDPCTLIVCPAEQSCIDGQCLVGDLCAEILCPNEGEVCDKRSGTCVAGGADDDGDGVTIAEGDCDDGDSMRYPGADEVCDGVDQDCDGVSDNGFPDSDEDGFDTCGIGIAEQSDCDDDDATRYPGRAEVCDGVDQDCDGTSDEDIASRPCSTDCGDGEERCEQGNWFCSAPEVCDCTPSGDTEIEACGNCGTRSRECDDSLEWEDWTTCTDEGCEPADTRICATECGSIGTERCTQRCEWGSCVPPAESCNRLDEDCDGVIDLESCLVPIFRFYNGVTGDHMYKADSTVADDGYEWESLTEFWIYRAPFSGATPLYQRYNGTDHLLAIDPTEGDDAGYTGATILGYLVLTPSSPLATDSAATMAPQTICRYYSASSGDHFVFTMLTEQEIADIGLPYILEVCAADVWGWYFDWP